MTKNPLIPFLAWSLFLGQPAMAQEAIQIEIDSAPVEVEIPKPAEPPAKQPQPAPPVQAQKAPPEQEPEKTEKGGHNYGVAIGVGALVAGLLAALAGGGGGGSSSTPTHP